MSFDAAILSNILESASDPGVYLNGCTIQLWGGADGNSPIVFADIKDHNGNPMRDGNQGLVRAEDASGTNLPGKAVRIGGGSGPTKFYIGDRNKDQVLRLTPDDDRKRYICWHTCGGNCTWYSFRAVVNTRGSSPGDSTSHFKARFSTKGRDSRKVGSVILEATSRPGFFVGGGTKPPNQGAMHTGWMGVDEAYMRIGIVSLGPDLAREYYRRRLESTGSYARVLCCKGEYDANYNTKAVCEEANYVSGSTMCDTVMQGECPPGTTDPMCGCSTNHASIQSIPDTSRQFQQIRAFPQCFLETCTDSGAYKFSSQRTNAGGVNCPNITICEQNIDLKTQAKLINSGIVQNCNQDAGTEPVPGGGTSSGGGTASGGGGTASGDGKNDVLLLVAGSLGLIALAIIGSMALWAVGFGMFVVVGWSASVFILGTVVALVAALT